MKTVDTNERSSVISKDLFHEEEILYQSSSFLVTLSPSLGEGKKEVNISPYIYKRKYGYYGLFIFKSEFDKKNDLYLFPILNVFDAFRIIEIIKALGVLERGIISPCTFVSAHDSQYSEKSFFTCFTRRISGYKGIMNKKIPQAIIDIHFNSQKTKFPFSVETYKLEEKYKTV